MSFVSRVILACKSCILSIGGRERLASSLSMIGILRKGDERIVGAMLDEERQQQGGWTK